jgi:hypothetical protein
MKSSTPLFFASILTTILPALGAQQGGSSPAMVRVNAPFAQRLIVEEKSMHPEIQKLGLHAVPPGQRENVIIANNLPEKIGKVSSAGDMQLVASGNPVAVNKKTFWDTFVPLHDRDNKIIGFLVMEVPLTTASTEQEAIAKGISIRDEVQRQAPTLETLFGPVHKQ